MTLFEIATEIAFTVPAVPVAQPRPRATTFAGHARVHELTHVKGSDGKRRQHAIVAFKSTCAMAARAAYAGPPLQGPLRLDVEFVFPRTSQQIWKTKPMPRLRHDKKPDRDNCEKALLDALRGLVFVDDSQICDGTVQKWIAAGNEQPHVSVSLSVLED